MTYAQCIEARRLLGLTQTELSKAAKVNRSAINNFALTGHLPAPKTGLDRMRLLTTFFEKSGLEFTVAVPAGVQLRRKNF